MEQRPLDAEPLDAEPLDAEPVDVQPADAEPVDAEPEDVQPVDAEPVDTGLEDVQPADAEPVDAEPLDIEPADAVDSPEPAGVTEPSADSTAGPAALDREDFLRRWHEVQVSFVDGPQSAVAEADSLLGDALREFVDYISAERAGIESGLNGAEGASTEDFRVAMVRYRDIFKRLLSA
jgi:hypothetical protein